MSQPPDIEAQHHADHQLRFLAIETKLDANTAVTEKLATDTAELVEMWKDAGVFFKWMRRFGKAAVFISQVVVGLAGLYGLYKIGWRGDK